MHVLMVTDSFPSPAHPYRGTFIGEQVSRLLDHVDRITVLCPTTYVPRFAKFSRVAIQASLPTRYELVKDRCDVLFPRYVKAPGYGCLWWTLAQWRRIVNRTVEDLLGTGLLSLIHAHRGGLSSWASIQAAKQYSLPCAVTYQGTEVHTDLVNRQNAWRLCRDSFRFADLNIFVSRSLEHTLKTLVQSEKRCEVLIRGVDLRTFYPPKQEAVRQPTVLFVGAVRASKGVFDLLEAWTQVIVTCPQAELWIVGSDYTQGRFGQAIRSSGHDLSVKILGPQPPSTVADHMRQVQILCLPSHGEGIPNCVMEAMACGLSIVATEVGGIPEIVESHRTGILVQKGNVQNLAEALIFLLQHFGHRSRLGEAAYEFAREHLDSRKATNHLMAMYRDLIATHHGKTQIVK